jgi:Ca2+-binding RTX toxin-like protein
MVLKIGTNQGEFLLGTQDTDVILGQAGNDTIWTFGDPAQGFAQFGARASITDKADVVIAGAGNDQVLTGGGEDVVFGGAGRDTIDGGPGNDHLWGGAGADVFKFEVLFASPGAPTTSGGIGAGNRDVIEDFHQGQDKIDLRGWDNTDVAGGGRFIGHDTPLFDPNLQAAYHFEGNATVIDLARLWFVPQPGYHGVYTGPAGQIELAGHIDLTASDFIF